MITLCPLDRNDADQVADLRVRPDQEQFAGTVAEALAEPAERFDLHMILKNADPIGIFKIDRQYARDYPFAAASDLGLRAVIMDHRVQGQGYGTAAMAALKTYLPTQYPKATNVVLTVNFRNRVAVHVYRQAGFVDTGEVWPHGQAGPQHIMKAALA